MKKHYESTVKGEGTSYSAPSVEILSISIEKGFANSITENTNKHILRL